MKNFFKNLDMKSWLILILLTISLFFGYKWFFSSNDGSNIKLELLEEENDKLREYIEINNQLIDDLELEVTNLTKIITKKELLIESLDLEINTLSDQVTNKKEELDTLLSELKEKKEKIQELKKNPIKREGTNLFDSLKEKIN